MTVVVDLHYSVHNVHETLPLSGSQDEFDLITLECILVIHDVFLRFLKRSIRGHLKINLK